MLVVALPIGLALLACGTLLPSQHAEASDIEHPIVLDGSTLLIRTVRIRLDGIDALEVGQKCTGAGNVEWECGLHAKRVLAQKIGNGPVVCRQLRIDASAVHPRHAPRQTAKISPRPWSVPATRSHVANAT